MTRFLFTIPAVLIFLLLTGCIGDPTSLAPPEVDLDVVDDINTSPDADDDDADAHCIPQNCQQLGAACGVIDNGCGRELDCEACPTGEECVDNLHCQCAPETDEEFCARHQVQCGHLEGEDNCGEDRILDCQFCEDDEVCDDNQCVCSPESDGELCAQEGYPCTEITVVDRCQNTRTLLCMECQDGQECGEDGRSCGDCIADSVETLCADNDLGCGATTVVNNCGSFQQIDCGGCDNAICFENSCCVPETCSEAGLQCGPGHSSCGINIPCGNCGTYDSWQPTGDPYPCCHATQDQTACLCQNEFRTFHGCTDGQCEPLGQETRVAYSNCTNCTPDNACSTSACNDGVCASADICDDSPTSCGCNTCEDCTEQNGWYPHSSTTPTSTCDDDADPSQTCTSYQEEYREYFCNGGTCDYSVEAFQIREECVDCDYLCNASGTACAFDCQGMPCTGTSGILDCASCMNCQFGQTGTCGTDNTCGCGFQ